MRFHVFLLYALLVSNVVFRLFTNKLGLLPKVFNIADVFITLWLVLLSLRYAVPTSKHRGSFSFGGRLCAFNLVLLAGAVLNLKFFHAPAALSQVIMWNEPLLLFLAISRLPFTVTEIEGFRRWLVRLIIFELAVGVLQVPVYLATGATEAIIGTFQGNAEQYQGFIMLGIFYLMARQQLETWNRRRLWGMIAAILCLVVLIDNKASWLGVLVSILLVMHFQGRSGAFWFLRPRYLVSLAFLFGLGAFVAIQLSPSLGKMHGFVEACRSGNFRDLGKIKAYDDILHSWGEQGQMALVGSGPGNFYSRSGTQFYLLGVSLAQTDSRSVRTFTLRTSNSMGGVINLTTKPPFYAHYYVDREIHRIGSAQVDSPFSSYAALLGETGIIGTLLYLSIYFGILRSLLATLRHSFDSNPQLYPMAVAAFGLCVYVMTDSVYNHWLETGRMTTIVWAMAGLLLKPMAVAATLKRVDDREDTAQPDGMGVSTAI